MNILFTGKKLRHSVTIRYNLYVGNGWWVSGVLGLQDSPPTFLLLERMLAKLFLVFVFFLPLIRSSFKNFRQNLSVERSGSPCLVSWMDSAWCLESPYFQEIPFEEDE